MFYSTRPHALSLAIVMAACIFLVDTLSSLQLAVASLYVVVILISAYDLHCRGIIWTGISCAALTALSYVLTHGFSVDGTAPLRSLVSFLSITITVVLVIRNRSANEILAEVRRERANLARFFSPEFVEQHVRIDAPLSMARRQKAAALFDRAPISNALTSRPYGSLAVSGTLLSSDRVWMFCGLRRTIIVGISRQPSGCRLPRSARLVAFVRMSTSSRPGSDSLEKRRLRIVPAQGSWGGGRPVSASRSSCETPKPLRTESAPCGSTRPLRGRFGHCPVAQRDFRIRLLKSLRWKLGSL
jgi:hypothetical protein